MVCKVGLVWMTSHEPGGGGATLKNRKISWDVPSSDDDVSRDAAVEAAPKMSANPDSINSVADAISVIDVPWERRVQTAAVASFVMALPATMVCFFVSLLLLLNPFTAVFMLVYAYHIYTDTSPHTGARKRAFVRDLKWWKHFANYFPMSLRAEAELDPGKKYVFGYHPHGIISVGALAAFGTEGLGFSQTFKGINVHLVTLPTNFRVPFLREIWLMLGICDSSKTTFRRVLSRGSGSAVAVVVGGAAESLQSVPGQIELTLCNRRGFVRQALLYGACLVPTVGFGETDVFETTQSLALKRLQEKAQKLMGFAIPIFHGRGVFQKVFGLLPYRRPVNIVVHTHPLTHAHLDDLLHSKVDYVTDWLTSTHTHARTHARARTHVDDLLFYSKVGYLTNTHMHTHTRTRARARAHTHTHTFDDLLLYSKGGRCRESGRG